MRGVADVAGHREHPAEPAAAPAGVARQPVRLVDRRGDAAAPAALGRGGGAAGVPGRGVHRPGHAHQLRGGAAQFLRGGGVRAAPRRPARRLHAARQPRDAGLRQAALGLRAAAAAPRQDHDAALVA